MNRLDQDRQSGTSTDRAADEAPRTGIVWIASYPKSGNTWTRVFIHNLMRVTQGEADSEHINKLTRYSGWDIGKLLYTDALGFEPTNDHRKEIASVRHLVQERIANAFDGIVFAKTHQALVMNHGSSTINFAVTSGAVYVVRNPLDVAISYAHHLGCPLDQAIATMAKLGYETYVTEKAVFEVYSSWSEHVLSWTRKAHDALYVMRYEDMLAEPHKTFGGLARHLLFAATPDQITDAVERSSFDKLKAQELESGFQEKPATAEQFFRDGRAGQWKDVLTREQIRRIVRDHGEQMERFGYLP